LDIGFYRIDSWLFNNLEEVKCVDSRGSWGRPWGNWESRHGL